MVSAGSTICLTTCPDIELIRYENGVEKKYCVKECDGRITTQEDGRRRCIPVSEDDWDRGHGNGDNGC